MVAAPAGLEQLLRVVRAELRRDLDCFQQNLALGVLDELGGRRERSRGGAAVGAQDELLALRKECVVLLCETPARRKGRLEDVWREGGGHLAVVCQVG